MLMNGLSKGNLARLVFPFFGPVFVLSKGSQKGDGLSLRVFAEINRAKNASHYAC